MRVIIQKFGGTSVVTPVLRRQVVGRISAAKDQGLAPVVVVSAMGRLGDPYATDTLLQLVKDSGGENQLREIDLLLSCGEVIAGVIVAQSLRAAGCPAVTLTGGQAVIITDRNFGSANIQTVKPTALRRHLEAGEIVVVAGFQ